MANVAPVGLELWGSQIICILQTPEIFDNYLQPRCLLYECVKSLVYSKKILLSFLLLSFLSSKTFQDRLSGIQIWEQDYCEFRSKQFYTGSNKWLVSTEIKIAHETSWPQLKRNLSIVTAHDDKFQNFLLVWSTCGGLLFVLKLGAPIYSYSIAWY